MKRILMLLSVAAMIGVAVALSGVAQAAPVGGKADAKCLAEAVRTLPPGFKPSTYTFHGGTEGNDNFDGLATTTAGPDVFCGFGGDDQIDVGFFLDEGDIFLGGEGNDFVDVNLGTFIGGPGDDGVGDNVTGTFNGGEGDDGVTFNESGATFNGGEGNDHIFANTGTLVGGPGADSVLFGPGPVDGSP